MVLGTKTLVIFIMKDFVMMWFILNYKSSIVIIT